MTLGYGILEVTWYGVERSKVKVRVRVRVQQYSVGSNSMSAF